MSSFKYELRSNSAVSRSSAKHSPTSYVQQFSHWYITTVCSVSFLPFFFYHGIMRISSSYATASMPAGAIPEIAGWNFSWVTGILSVSVVNWCARCCSEKMYSCLDNAPLLPSPNSNYRESLCFNVTLKTQEGPRDRWIHGEAMSEQGYMSKVYRESFESTQNQQGRGSCQSL